MVSRRPGVGVLCAFLSSVAFSLASFMVKLLEGVNQFEVILVRMCTILLLIFPWVSLTGHSWGSLVGPAGSQLWLVIRGVLGTAVVVSYYYSIQHLPLGDATVIAFSSPMFAGILGWLILKDKFHYSEILTAIVCLVGVTLIARPTFIFGSHGDDVPTENSTQTLNVSVPNVTAVESHDQSKRIIASAVGLCGALFSSLAFVSVRKMGMTVSYLAVILYFTVIALICATGFLLITGQFTVPACGRTRWILIGVGVASFGGQITLTWALQLEKAVTVALIRNSDVILTYCLQWLFISAQIDVLSVVGAIVVTTGALVSGLRRYIAEKQKKKEEARMAVEEFEKGIELEMTDEHEA